MVTAENIDTNSLLAGIRNGDNAVLGLIFSTCKEPLIRLLQGKAATLPEAEDIFMDALEAVFVRLQKGPLILKDCTFQTYLTAICLKQWYKKCRRKKFRAAVTPEALTVLRSNDDLEEALFQTERAALFWDAFEKLGEACQQVLHLALIEKRPLQEVGEHLKYSYDYVRKKKSRCQKKLIEKIKEDDRFQELMS